MNTAQCVIQGHKPKFRDTKGDIVKMLVICNLFVMNAGIIFSWVMVSMNTFNRPSGRVIKNTASALWFSSHFLSVLCIFHFFVAGVLAFHFSSVFFFFATLAFPIIFTVCANIFSTFVYRLLSFHIDHELKAVFCLYTLGGNTICYISCWLVIVKEESIRHGV